MSASGRRKPPREEERAGADAPPAPALLGPGSLHLVAESQSIHESIESFDLSRARLLAHLNDYWRQRVRDLVPAVRALLGVQNVWQVPPRQPTPCLPTRVPGICLTGAAPLSPPPRCDTEGSEQAAQSFVLWAGNLLREKEAFAAVSQQESARCGRRRAWPLPSGSLSAIRLQHGP